MTFPNGGYITISYGEPLVQTNYYSTSGSVSVPGPDWWGVYNGTNVIIILSECPNYPPDLEIGPGGGEGFYGTGTISWHT